jgi:cell division septation protein DedD
MASTTDDAFHEIQLNGKQLVFLFMAVVVVSVVIFLCGVLVGRGVRGESSGPLEASAAPAVPDAVADAPPSVTPPGTPAAANEDLSYPGRLAASGPARESLKPSEAAKPAPPSPASAPAASPPPAAPAVADAPAAPSEPAGAGFAIQVAALRQRAEADTVARGLSSKGYPAYVLSPDAGAPPVFRVRVGKFKDRREAESVAARLQKEEQFKPWIVR